MKTLVNLFRSAICFAVRTLPVCALLLAASCAAPRRTTPTVSDLPHTPVSMLFTAPQGAQVWLNGDVIGNVPCRATVTSFEVTALDITADEACLATMGADPVQIETIKKLGHERLRGQVCVANYDSTVNFALAADDFIWALTTGEDVILKATDSSIAFKGSPGGVSQSDRFVNSPVQGRIRGLAGNESQGMGPGQTLTVLAVIGMGLLPLTLL